MVLREKSTCDESFKYVKIKNALQEFQSFVGSNLSYSKMKIFIIELKD